MKKNLALAAAYGLLVAAAGAVIVYGLSLPVQAAETAPAVTPPAAASAAKSPFADPNCPTVDEVAKLLAEKGETVVVLDAKSLLGATTEPGSGRILVSTFGSDAKYVVFGTEMGGCLNGPSPIAKIIPDKGA